MWSSRSEIWKGTSCSQSFGVKGLLTGKSFHKKEGKKCRKWASNPICAFYPFQSAFYLSIFQLHLLCNQLITHFEKAMHHLWIKKRGRRTSPIMFFLSKCEGFFSPHVFVYTTPISSPVSQCIPSLEGWDGMAKEGHQREWTRLDEITRRGKKKKGQPTDQLTRKERWRGGWRMRYISHRDNHGKSQQEKENACRWRI